MKKCYVFDACAFIALFKKEIGYENVLSLLEQAENREVYIVMNKINLLEIYYDFYRSVGSEKAMQVFEMIKNTPIIINDMVSDELFFEAGRIKAQYKLSLADSLALAETKINNASLLTADHHEFDIVEKKENISFCWLR